MMWISILVSKLRKEYLAVFSVKRVSLELANNSEKLGTETDFGIKEFCLLK
jgi:hypothetical protein